jgi:formate dehydrogenase maturation protein FdhE
VRAALERAAKERPELAATIALALDLFFEDEVVAAGVPDRLPAIDAATLELDWEVVARRVREVAAIAARHDARLAGVEIADVRAAARAWLRGDAPGELAGFLLTHALRPFLRPLAAAALSSPAARAWTRGDCPACGGPPDLAALEAEGGARRLLCARCDAEWSFARVGCPFCANQDREKLGYFPAGEGAYRLYVCDACGRYLKTVDLRETFRAAPLPVERVLSVGLDVAAAQAGYRPPS